MITKTDFELKNLKYFEGTDGLCFSMTVYIKGKKAFTAQNDGQGGDNFYTPCDLVHGKTLLAEAHEFVKTLPPFVLEDWNISGDYDLDILLEELMNEKLENAELKRKCKGRTLYQLTEDGKGQYWEIKKPYSEGIKMFIMGKHPDAVIINERFI